MSDFFKTNNSIKFFTVLLVCGFLNTHASTLTADELHAHPTAIVFNAVQGHALNDTRTIFLFTSLGTSLYWSLSKDVSWLTTDSQTGEAECTLTVGVNTTGMLSGIYHGNITIQSAQSSADPITVQVTLVINPDVPVNITTWENDYSGAMSVSVDDGYPSGFDDLKANGFSGTYVYIGTTPPSFYSDYFNAGMELGSHLVSHPCSPVSDDALRSEEIEPNISGICANTPEPCADVITLAWPCGYTNYREEAVATEYFLSARGYNINQLEDATPANFMNLKSFNSHEHTPYPPSDLKTVVDAAVNQQKWFNLVLHSYSNDDGAINYAATKDIWVTSIGTVIKYILQRDRFILTNYTVSPDEIMFNVSRLAIPSTASKVFENAFGPNDISTVQIDVDDNKVIENVLVNGVINSYQTRDLSGNKVILTNVKLESAINKTIEIKYLNQSPYNLTISGVTANNKVYDGTTNATLNTGSATLVGVLGGDVVTLVSTGAIGTFADKNVATGKVVATSGFSLTGTDAGKYTLTDPTLTANITRAGLTISGVTASNKVYDGTTAAILNTASSALVGVFGGDAVSLISSGAVGSFANKNVATGKTVSTSGFSLTGTDAGNYTLTQPTLTADIATAGLTISGVTASNKVYDGNSTATLNTGSSALVGVFGGDVVSLISSGAVGSFANKNVATGKSVTTSGFSLTGTDAGNYTLTQPTLTANITRAGLTISGVTANNKVYDGTTAAILNTSSSALVGVIGGDVVSLISSGAVGIFADKNVDTGKSVSTSGFSLTGTDAGNYTLTQPTLTANITAAGLTISGVIVNNKVYDGNTTATLNTGSSTLVGVFGGDVVSLISSGAVGSFANKYVGTGKTVSITGLTLGGIDGGNYALTQPSSTANITKAELTVSGVTANNKVYDGSTIATLNTGSAGLVDVFGTDVVNLITTGAVGIFADKNVGTGKSVSTSGFSITGTDAGNYMLTQPTITADITTSGLTISGVTASDKVYDGTTAATLNAGIATLIDVITGDVVSLVSTEATGTFEDKNVAIDKSVSTSGFSLTGTDAGNYTLTQPTLTAKITTAGLTISGITASNKVYDGTTKAILNTANSAFVGVFGGDVVILISSGAVGSFANKNVGTGKTVSITGLTLGGVDGGNYTLTQPSSIANISKAELTVSGVTVNNKVYDGSTAATLVTGSAALVGVFGTDIVNLITTGAVGIFADKNVGTGKVVSTTGFTLSGADEGNYTLTQPTTTADITSIALAVTRVTADNKVYDGTTSATLNNGSATLVGVLGGDVVTIVSTGAKGNFANKNVGTGIAVSTSGFSLTGTDAVNYTLTQPTLTANITTAGLTVSGITASNKVYDGTITATLKTENAVLVGVLEGDDVNLVSTGATGTFADKNAGTTKEVTTSGFSLGGTDSGNYALMQPSLIADISAKPLTITAIDLSKSYGTTLSFTGSEFAAVGLVTGDVISGVTISSYGAPASADVGIFTISIGGGVMENYNILYVSGILTVVKSRLVVKADDKTRVYGSDNPVLTISYIGFIDGEDASVIDVKPFASTTALSASNAGLYPITLAGGSDNNYDLDLVDGSLTVEKAPLTITAENSTRVYRSVNPAFGITYSGFVLGEDKSVLERQPNAETDADINSNAGVYDINVSGASDPNYSFIYNKGTLTITKADQFITFAPIPDRLRMTQEARLNATASSGLDVSFKVSDPNIGRLNDNILTVEKEGKLTISATQEGNQNWNPAPVVTQSIVTLPTFDGILSLFTPNNDGINDYWYFPNLEQYGKLQVTVYNRYGQAVYRADSYKNDWDGTWNGNPLPSATYYYIIKSSEKGIIKGVVNIIR